MTWRKRTIMEMAREAGFDEWQSKVLFDHLLEQFAALVRADEAERYKWDIHSCGPTCTKIGCVAVREAVKAEREACAKVCAEDGVQAMDFTGGTFVGGYFAKKIIARGDS